MKQLLFVLSITCFVALQPHVGFANYAPISTDTTVTIPVSGNCIQCKHRIEAAATTKGVVNAVWTIATKQLQLTYRPAQISIEKIEGRILAAGHDVGTAKATDEAYNQLPACCLYRNSKTVPMQATELAASPLQPTIKGVVVESDNKGKLTPLANASVYWLHTHKPVLTDVYGVFSIVQTDITNQQLVVTYAGFKADTVTISDVHELKIILAANNQLKEVVVTDTRRSTFIASISPIRTEIMSDKELLKAACCNLSESFETNPSVDVSFNDAVTGSKQIQLLGLSGNYTQLTVENLPGPRGIATPLGLNAIAGPWVESIQLTKGIGSVANGYESIAGQINVELKKPENSEQLFANAYINDFGKSDVNLNIAKKISKKWSAGLMLHDDFLANKIDGNNDGFKDMPTGNQFSMVNRYKFDNNKGVLIQFGIKALNDSKLGGQTAFDEAKDKLGSNTYGLGIKTERYEGFAKIGYIFPEKKYKSIGLQLSAISHHQNAYFGTTVYNATQKNVYGNFIYQSIINNSEHKFRTGFSFLYDQYNEDFKSNNYQRTEIVPGAFFEYTYTPIAKLNVVAGLRADYNSLFGAFVTPRLNVRYEPIKGTTIRLSGGRGQRTANIFAENTSVLVSARDVQIIGASAGKAYGLNAEVAWNKGISIDQKLKLFGNSALLSIDFYRNDFTNQVVVDVENPRLVQFYNLQGSSFSNSFQTGLTVEPVKKLEIHVAYRWFDVKTTYGTQLLQRPLLARNRAFVSIDYATTNGWKFDYTVNYNGTKRIPSTVGNTAAYQLPTSSPDFVMMNAQISKTVGKKYPMDFYVGGENLGNFFQKGVIVAADQPFSKYFDASLVWGPVTGRMLYAGWRFKIK